MVTKLNLEKGKEQYDYCYKIWNDYLYSMKTRNQDRTDALIEHFYNAKDELEKMGFVFVHGRTFEEVYRKELENERINRTD